jgi:hypothetical protein
MTVPPGGLLPTDVDVFDALGIPSDLIAAADIRRVTHREAVEEVGIRYRSEHLEGLAFPYRHPETKQLLTFRVRRDHPELDSRGRPIAKYVAPPDRHHLYFPPGAGALLTDTSVTVAIVEAEKSVLACMAAAVREGRPLLAVGTGGCWGWRGIVGKTTDAAGARVDEKGPLPDLDRIEWQARDVVILFDSNTVTNAAVRAAREALARDLAGRGAHVRIADLPLNDGINGPDDFRAAHGDQALFALLDGAKRGAIIDADARASRGSQATEIVRLALASGATLFHDDEVSYVSAPVGTHRATYALRSRAARSWLVGLYFDETGKAPGAQGLADAINTLDAHACRGPQRPVWVRIGRDGDAIYVDLGTPDWRVVEVTRHGWRMVDVSPMAFRRPRALLPLPEPVRGGAIAELRPFLNLAGERDWILVVAWLIGALRGRGPYPPLILQGEQDAGKSSGARLLRTLIDPNLAPLRREPRDARDLMIAATNAHVLNFDNLSGLSRGLSDDLCRLATGGGFSTRALYENREEEIFDASRPILLNGIAELATRPDLVSRALFVAFPSLRDTRRRTEDDLARAFAAAQPRILGALLDAVAAALARESSVTLSVLPRMADFARWVVAAELACPWKPGQFLNVYAVNRQQAIEAVLEGDVVADLAQTLCADDGWQGTATNFLAELNTRATESQRRSKDWFTKPRQVADALRRLAPALRRIGVDVRHGRAGHRRTRLVELKRVDRDASASSAARKEAIDEVFCTPDADAGTGQDTASSASASAMPVRASGLADRADAADAPDRALQAIPQDNRWTIK